MTQIRVLALACFCSIMFTVRVGNSQKLAELEKEEELRIAGGMYAVPKIELDETMREIKDLARQIR